MNSFYINSLSTHRPNNDYSNFISQINHYNTLSKYAIAAKYRHTDQKVTSSETTFKATKFLSNFNTNYTNLDQAITKLKSALTAQEDKSTDIVAATKDYVAAYNSTTKFLDAHSTSSTTRLNTIKASHKVATTVNATELASIGISKTNDGSLKLDEKKLNEALAKNSSFTKHILTGIANRTAVSTKMATTTTKSTLLAEQNKALATSSSQANDVTYENFMKLAKNPRALNNYYCSLATLGILVNVSL